MALTIPKEIPAHFAAGTHLDLWTNQVEGKIAGATSKEPLDVSFIERGQRILWLIGNGRLYFSKHLVKTPEQLCKDDILKHHYTLIKGHVDKFLKDEKDPDSIEQTTRELPVKDHKPKVTSVTPKYLVAEKEGMLIHVHGRFRYGPDMRYKPFLFLGETSFPALPSTTQDRLDFRLIIPFGEKNKRTFSVFTLKVPYETGYIQEAKETGLFRLHQGFLPQLAGSCTVFLAPTPLNPPKLTEVRKPFTIVSTAHELQESASTDWKTHTFNWTENEGIYVNPQSLKIVSLECICDAGDILKDRFLPPKFVKIEPQEVSLEVDINHSPLIKPFTLKFDVIYSTQTDPLPAMLTATFDLPWNVEIPIQKTPGNEVVKIAFVSSDGDHEEFPGEIKHPYLKKVQTEGGFALLAQAITS